MDSKFQSNKERDRILQELGYSNYREYRDSDLWRRAIRPEVIKESGGKCCVCGSSDNLQVHHMDYNRDNLSGKDTNSMVSLCNKCHIKIEFKFKGSERIKLSLEQANSRLRNLIKKKSNKHRHKKS